MAKKRTVGNLLALAVLSYLTQRPMHPYELSRTLRDNGDARSIKFNHGSLYMVVQQLANAGYITEQETNRDGQRPERTVYALTDAGRAELRDWLRELVEEPQHEYPHFVAALSLIAALPPADVLVLLRRRLDRLADLRTEIRRTDRRRAGPGRTALFLIEEEYRLPCWMPSRVRRAVHRPDQRPGDRLGPDVGRVPQAAAASDERQKS
jgi:DNA-binding PadR family transcriptional regulator